MDICGDKPGDVGDVSQEIRIHGIGNRSPFREIEPARISCGANHNQLRAMLLREFPDGVHVDAFRLGINAIVNDIVVPAREVLLQPMAQMPAVIELQRQNGVARFQNRVVGSHIRLSAGVRLNIYMVNAEELLGAIYRQGFDAIHELTTVIVTRCRITLGILVRQDAALCLHHGYTGVILGRD